MWAYCLAFKVLFLEYSKEVDILGIISGSEPMRSQFEKKLKQACKKSQGTVFYCLAIQGVLQKKSLEMSLPIII